jgi:O-antigen ligase
MKRLDDILRHLIFGTVTMVLLGAPWLFGAWEMWWFWPFAVCLFVAAGCLGVRCILSLGLGRRRLGLSGGAAMAAIAYLPFLLYALIRAVQADVRMDAERSFLLQLTPFLLGLAVVLGMSRSQRRVLAMALPANFFLLGSYGIANHYLAGNATVLWVPGFPQYQEGFHRATGTYFCPDHFAGLMECGLALAAGMLLARATGWLHRLGLLAAMGVALWGIVLSKSRGAGLVTGSLAVCALWWGSAAWPRRARWMGRVGGAAALAMALAFAVLFEGDYVKRFKAYPWTRIEQSDRYQMFAATLRGWRSAPVWGIGPGMHQNLWPHFAPSPDGDRAKGIWPRFRNNNFHSYESHNDWLQLLEEYGVVGVVLFLVAMGGVVFPLGREWRRRVRAADEPAGPDRKRASDGLLIGALLALTALAAHSLGDFNLQIPATTWLLAGIVGLALAAARAERRRPAEGTDS